MARFIYRMQNILNIKQQLEEQAKQNFALMRLKLNEEEALLSSMRVKRVELVNHAKELRLEGTLDMLELRDSNALIKYQDEIIKQQTMRVKVAQKNLEAARAKMQEAILEREIQDKLREKAFDEFVKEENLKETKEIDELTSYTYGRNADKRM